MFHSADGVAMINPYHLKPQSRIELIIVQFHLLGGPNSGCSMLPTIFPIILLYPVCLGEFSFRSFSEFSIMPFPPARNYSH